MIKTVFVITAILCCFITSANAQTVSIQDGQLSVNYENQVAIAVDFSPDGALLSCGLKGSPFPDQESGSVELRDAKTGRLMFDLKAEFGELKSLAFSPDGRFIAAVVGTGGWNVRSEFDTNWPDILGAAFLWYVKTGVLKHKITIAGGQALSIAFSPDSRYMAIGSGDTKLQLWDLATNKWKWVVHTRMGRTESVAFSLNGKTIVTPGGKIWDASTGKLGHSIELQKGQAYVTAVTFSPENNILVVAAGAAGKDRLQFWNTEAQKWVRSFEISGSVGEMKFSHDAGSLIFSRYYKTGLSGLVVWDRIKGKVTNNIDAVLTSESAFAVAPNERVLAVCHSKDYRYGNRPLTSTINLHKF